MKRRILVLTGLAITGVGSAAIAPCAQADDGTPVLHPIEKVCIEYELSGQMQTGTIVRCHRDYGYEQYEIQNIQVGFMGMTQSQNQHVITVGETIYSINLQTNTGTKTKNPLYANVVSALENTSPEEMGAQFISAMGYSATSETKTIANTQCTVYSAPSMGTACLTEDGLMLEQLMMGNNQVATSVSIGDAGDDANYALYQNVPITEGPDLSEILNGGLPGLPQQ